MDFRTHYLLPHKSVGAFVPDHPLPIDIDRETTGLGKWRYLCEGKPFLNVHHGPDYVWRITALDNVWLQEPGLTQTWRGFTGEAYIQGGKGKPYKPVTKKYYVTQKDAHRSTVHFSRYSFWKYVDCIKMKYPNRPGHFIRSDGGFSKLLLSKDKLGEDWKGCRIFGEDREPIGTTTGFEMLKRWEAAGKEPDLLKIHWVGWTGGAGAVTNIKGQDVGSPDNRFVWQPRSWKFLPMGHSIEQRVWPG